MTTTTTTTTAAAAAAATATAREKLRKDLDDHIAWVEKHRGNVDFGVFREESARLAAEARRLAGIREWAGWDVEGVCALDFCAAVLGVSLPGIAWEVPDLPGAGKFRAHCHKRNPPVL